jgi:hypothetical protein
MPDFCWISPLYASRRSSGGLWLGSTLTFAAALYGIGRLPVLPPVAGISQPALRAVAEGFTFIRRNKVLYGAFLSD